MGSLPYGNTFVVIGGHMEKDGHYYSGYNSTYLFDPDKNAWNELDNNESRLDRPRGASAVMLVDEKWFPGC